MISQNLPFVSKISSSLANDKLQVLVYAGLSLLIFAITGILYLSNKLLFRRFIGSTDPLVLMVATIITGFVLLSFLLSQNWFAIFKPKNLNGLLRFFVLALLLGIIIILFDTQIPFPADTNIIFPHSLLFYPAIAFVVEILFHVLPLTILLLILAAVLKNVNFETIVWIAIFTVAILEPAYHLTGMRVSEQFPLWAFLYVGFHIFLINFIQLLIFKRFDFISMYSFRLVYYLIWHIAWGYLRLELLF